MVKLYAFGHRLNFDMYVTDLFGQFFGIGFRKTNYFLAKYGLTRQALHVYKVPGGIDHFVNIEISIDSTFMVDALLRRTTRKAMNFALYYKTYRGLRRSQGLPFSGQRTHSNAKTTRRLFRSNALTAKLAKAGIVGVKTNKGKK
jgi:ribosomal protein S13